MTISELGTSYGTENQFNLAWTASDNNSLTTATFFLYNDSLNIYGNPNVRIKKILNVFSNGDHRIAMSWTILGLLLGGRIKINNFETVNTSFPNFIKLIKKIGGKIEIK